MTPNEKLPPPLPPPRVADALAKLEAAVRQEERAGTSHERQEAEAHTWDVRMELRAALAPWRVQRRKLSPEIPDVELDYMRQERERRERRRALWRRLTGRV